MNLFDFYQKMRQNNIILSFQGIFAQDILVDLGEMIKEKLLSQTISRLVIKKVFSVFIELSQNVLHHSAEKSILQNKNNELGAGIIVISETEKGYIITSGNLINNEEIAEIKNRFVVINKLNKIELKDHYKEILRKPRSKNNEDILEVGEEFAEDFDFEFNMIST